MVAVRNQPRKIHFMQICNSIANLHKSIQYTIYVAVIQQVKLCAIILVVA